MLRGCGWQVLLVDADVEAGLPELFLDVDFALLGEGQEIASEPGDLGEVEAVFSDVYSLAGEMRRGSFAFGWGGVPIGAYEALLKLDGADGGVDLERGPEAGVVGTRHGDEESRGPGPAVAAVGGEALVDDEGAGSGNFDEDFAGAHVGKIAVILDAVEAFTVRDFVLVE